MKIDNKLIAEFMGYVYDDDRFFMEDSEGVRLYENLPHELQYHTSWDWLMPVVEKIYQLDSNADFFGSINLEATYKEVVEFINEYTKPNEPLLYSYLNKPS